MLRCEFTLCLYQAAFERGSGAKEGICRLESIIINEYGMCESAVLAEMPEDMLMAQKERGICAHADDA